MLPIHFAPLQGHTDDVYRRIHHQLVGGIEHYYTPFVRVEAGDIRSKDRRDIDPKNNVGVPMIPQIIFKSLKEFLFLLNEMEALGYRAIDLNMGCPFPLQARHGRGSGLLAHPDIVAEVADIIKARPELTFSVKMRLGWENTEEWTPILDILNDTPLAHIALHPRTGTQQYKGSIHREIFERFYETCRHPLLYNGDLTTLEQLHAIEKCYPRLAGLMIGRGLLARPTLAREYAERREWSHEEHIHTLRLLHSKLMEEYARIVKGEAQLHSKLRPYWEYTEPLIGHKPHKKIMKSGNLRNYLNAIEELR
jgi:tRNA-dihydrouridine synthase